MARTYQLPNGSYTRIRGEYYRAWEELARPILLSTGLTLLSFDPVVRIGTPNGNLNIALPVWFLERFNTHAKDDNASA
jgi:hypothetical protein